MNCKPGDMAIVVYSKANHEGSIVEVLRYYGWAHFSDGSSEPDCWLVKIRRKNGVDREARKRGADACVPDSWLRPIRPGDISDEEVKELFSPKAPEKQGEKVE